MKRRKRFQEMPNNNLTFMHESTTNASTETRPTTTNNLPLSEHRAHVQKLISK